MRSLTAEQMGLVNGGQAQLILMEKGTISSYSNYQFTQAVSGSFHYSAWDCVGFFGGLAGMTGAAFATLGIGAIVGGLLSFSGMVSSAGNCEGYLKTL